MAQACWRVPGEATRPCQCGTTREKRLYVYIAIAFDFVAEESEAREGVLVVWRCGVDNGQVWEGKTKRLYGLIDLG